MRKLIALAALLALAACAAPPPAAPSAAPAPPSPAAGGGAVEVPLAVVGLAQLRLGERLGLRPEELVPLEGAAVEWSDASLGCPAPDALYPQVITPGYRLTLLDPDGLAYDLRSSVDAQLMLLCEGGLPTPLDPVELERQT